MIAGIGRGILGSIEDLSIYKMRGVEDPIVRRKGGPSKQKIQTDPNLEQVRNSIAEFGGRAQASKWIMWALRLQKPLADYNIAGPLNALMTPVQKMDTTSDYGQRNVRLSAYRPILNGFSMNRHNTFDSTVRFPVTHILNRATGQATVYLPDLMPGISFFAPESFPWFSIQVTLGIVPDIIYRPQPIGKYGPTHPDYGSLPTLHAATAWQPVAQGAAATTIELKYEAVPPDEQYTWVLAIGIRYGIQYNTHEIWQAKRAGCAKVLEAK